MIELSSLESYSDMAARIWRDYNLDPRLLNNRSKSLNTFSKKRAKCFIGYLNIEHLARSITFWKSSCAICGEVPIYKSGYINWQSWRGLHFDHWVPISRGGENVSWNILPMCQTCNSSKGPRLPDNWLNHFDIPNAHKIRLRISEWIAMAKSADWGLGSHQIALQWAVANFEFRELPPYQIAKSRVVSNRIEYNKMMALILPDKTPASEQVTDDEIFNECLTWMSTSNLNSIERVVKAYCPGDVVVEYVMCAVRDLCRKQVSDYWGVELCNSTII